MTTPAALFRRCGIALFGNNHRWKEQLGIALDIKTDSIDAFSKGASRIPPGVWRDVRHLLFVRYEGLGNTIGDFHDMATATFEGEAIPPSE